MLHDTALAAVQSGDCYAQEQLVYNCQCTVSLGLGIHYSSCEHPLMTCGQHDSRLGKFHAAGQGCGV